MRKRLDTRFPAPRIKKIMQADEDVGKIAMAVPLLVSKALELFLQDLCNRTYEITLRKGAKTVNCLHLKQCVQSFNVYDFLRDTVSKVPDLGGSNAAADDRSATKRRKILEDEEYVNEDESKRISMHETRLTNCGGRGRGRGRGGGRGRGNRMVQRESAVQDEKFEDDPDISNQNSESPKEHSERSNNILDVADSRTTVGEDADRSVINFDLNVDLNENGDPGPSLAGAPSGSLKKPALDAEHEDIPGWSLHDIERLAVDPVQLANLNSGMDVEEEDYDEEG